MLFRFTRDSPHAILSKCPRALSSIPSSAYQDKEAPGIFIDKIKVSLLVHILVLFGDVAFVS